MIYINSSAYHSLEHVAAGAMIQGMGLRAEATARLSLQFSTRHVIQST